MATLTHKKRPGRVRRLSEIETDEVSIVDRPANRRRFLVIKYEDGSTHEVEIGMDIAHDPTATNEDVADNVPEGSASSDNSSAETTEESSATSFAISRQTQETVLQPTAAALSRLATVVKAVQDADTSTDADNGLPTTVSNEIAGIAQMLTEVGVQQPNTTTRLQEVASQALLASNTLDLEEGVEALRKTVTGLDEVATELEAVASEPQPDQVELLHEPEADVTLPLLLRQVSERADRAAGIFTVQTATSKAAVASEVSELLGLVKAIEEVEIAKASPGKRLAKVVRTVAARASALANTLMKTGGAPNARILRSVKSLLSQLERAAARFPAAKSEGGEDPKLPEDIQKAAGMIARILQEISERGATLAEKIEGRDGGPSKAHVRSVGSLLRKLRGLVNRFPSVSAAKGDDSDAVVQDTDGVQAPVAVVAQAAPVTQVVVEEATVQTATEADAGTQAVKADPIVEAATVSGGDNVDNTKVLEDVISKAVKAALEEANKTHAGEIAELRTELASVKKGVQAPATSPAAGDTPTTSGNGSIPDSLLFPRNYNDPAYRAQLEKRGLKF